MGSVTLLVLLFFVIWAILGVQLFAGELWRCSDPEITVQVSLARSTRIRKPRKEAPSRI